MDVIHPVAFSESFRRRNAAALATRREQMSELPGRWFTDLDALMVAAVGSDLGPELGAIRCPTMVVAAEHDAFIPRERSEALAAAIPGARFCLLEGAGHAAVVEKPEEVIRRAVKGMLPRGTLGRQMLRKLKVYAGPEHPHDAQQPKALELN